MALPKTNSKERAAAVGQHLPAGWRGTPVLPTAGAAACWLEVKTGAFINIGTRGGLYPQVREVEEEMLWRQVDWTRLSSKLQGPHL